MRKLINVASVCSIFSLIVFAPVKTYALQRAANTPSIIVFDGHPEPPIKHRLQRLPNTPSIVVLDGHSDPPISVRLQIPNIGRGTLVRALALTLQTIGMTSPSMCEFVR